MSRCRTAPPLPLIALLRAPESRAVVSPDKIAGSIRAASGIARAASDANIPRNPHIMLAELNALVPKDRREKVDRQLVRSIIGLKHRMGLGIHWTNQLANEQHKPVRRRFDKRTVFAKQVDEIWAADLVDMSAFSRSNKGHKYLLTVIGVFNKYGWIVPLKTKTGKEVAQAFRKLFLNGHPSRLWPDKVTEFYNQQLKAVLAANNVMLYSTENEEKSSTVERWNKTMKNIIWKYFTANNTQKYIDVLSSMVEKYNNTYHRSIKLTPSDARNPSSYQHVHNALYANSLGARDVFCTP